MSNLKEAVEKIRKVGTNNYRIVSDSQNPKMSILEINENGNWSMILKPMSREMLEDVVRQANNRLILG